MGRTVSVHSYRGGTGKSNITANLAYLLASRGQRVAVLDTDIQSPGVHLILGLKAQRIVHTLSDFVLGRCELAETVYDVSRQIGLDPSEGQVYLLPSSMAVDDISRVIAEGYDVSRLGREFRRLMDELALDFLFLDTHPGLNRETLLTIAVSDDLVVLLRPDTQDYHGTAVLLEVANRLRVPRIRMVVNKMVNGMTPENVRAHVQAAYGQAVIGVLPLDEDMAIMGSRDLFSRVHPRHPLTMALNDVANHLLDLEQDH
ncbi:MAG: MinD/ParA family protein [Ectothiorhodospiraceae bacterium]|nr:MinD/ParA family protein [Ectothiorhodospiraceae bacterium]